MFPAMCAMEFLLRIFFMVLYLQSVEWRGAPLERVQCREEGSAFSASYRERNGRQGPASLWVSRLRLFVVALVLLPVSIPFTSLVVRSIYRIARGRCFLQKGQKKATAFRLPQRRWPKNPAGNPLRAQAPAVVGCPSFWECSVTLTVLHSWRLLCRKNKTPVCPVNIRELHASCTFV